MEAVGPIANRREVGPADCAIVAPLGAMPTPCATACHLIPNPQSLIPLPYLLDLSVRLATAAAAWPEAFRRRHAEYLAAAQRDDGGFAGRRAASDLYYTSFGLRGLALVGALDASRARRAEDFLRSKLDDDLPSVELYSLIASAALVETAGDVNLLDDRRRAALAAAIDAHRHADGGFAKRPGQPASSTYHTFLAVMTKQLLGIDVGDCEPIVELVRSRRRGDGGFVEIPQMRASGTNPTAAAVVLLAELGRLDEATGDGAARLLAAMQNAEGGFRANTAIPLADLLSTLAALASLARLDRLATINTHAAAEFARGLEQPDGGFRGGAWDDVADVEYTFYALGTLALAAG